jgi:hypothetical protein
MRITRAMLNSRVERLNVVLNRPYRCLEKDWRVRKGQHESQRRPFVS